MKHSPFASIAKVASLCVACVALTLLSGCGGGGSPSDPTVTAITATDVGGAVENLNPAFAGTWTGTSTIKNANTLTLYISASNTQQIVEVSGQNGTMKSICFDGKGSITATGTGNSAQWNGPALSCLPVNFGTAFGEVAITLTAASATLSDDNKTLTARAHGTATGLSSTTQDIIFEFTGTK
jgi:hypothetical protein